MATATKPMMSDEAVKAKTGKTWPQWFKLLDAAGAKQISHQEIVALLNKKNDIGPWWQQMITVTYEQARGLRAKHQKPSGFEISVSRTVNASVSEAFKAWTEEKTRKKWLPANLSIRKSTTNKSLRINWEDGQTSLNINFYPKGDKCQVVAQPGKLPSARSAATMKTFWAKALDRLKDLIE